MRVVRKIMAIILILAIIFNIFSAIDTTALSNYSNSENEYIENNINSQGDENASEGKRRTISITVRKIWKTLDGDVIENSSTKNFSSLRIFLKRKVNGINDESFNKSSKAIIIKYNDDYNKSWRHTFNNLEEYDQSKNEYKYYIVEEGEDLLRSFQVEKYIKDNLYLNDISKEIKKKSVIDKDKNLDNINSIIDSKILDKVDENSTYEIEKNYYKKNNLNLENDSIDSELYFNNEKDGRGLTIPITNNNTYEKTKYYKESPLGIIGGFHLVGFTSIKTQAHTNGNILTDELEYISNFGTTGLDEVSYFRKLKYPVFGFKSSYGGRDSVLVVGKDLNVGTADNGNSWTLNGGKVDIPNKSEFPNNLWQDTDVKFVDIDDVKNKSISISNKLSKYEDINTTPFFNDMNNQHIDISNPGGMNVYNLNPDEFSSNSHIDMHGFEKDKNGTLLINVDLKGRSSFTIPGSRIKYKDGEYAPTSEVTEWQSGNVIWNIYDSSKPDNIYRGKVENSRVMTGIILSPGALVDLMQNFNGTVVADKIIVTAESHRTDFTGKTIEYPADFEFTKINVQSHTLMGAVFILKKENNNQVIQRSISDKDGKISFTKLKKGTYYLYEEKAPSGYMKLEGAIAKIVVDKNGNKNITTLHGAFNPSGNFIENEKEESIKTKVKITKEWFDSYGEEISKEEAKNLKIYAKLRRKVKGVIDQSFNKYEKIQLNYDNSWSVIIENLEAYDKNNNKYTYYVEEFEIPNGFTEISSNHEKQGEYIENSNGEIKLKLKNKAKKPVYPQTGGIGNMITGISSLLISIGFYIRKKQLKLNHKYI